MAAWREMVRELARERATVEARQQWGVGEEEAIPFNYRWDHVQAVVGLALQLAAALGADGEVVEAAAWLHDVCKLEQPHEITGAEEAERVLARSDFPPAKIDAVSQAIRVHRGLYREDPATPLEPLEAAILWDADKLSKLGVGAIVYVASAPYSVGRSLQERLQDFDEYAADVLSRTVRSMNTAPAREMAEGRYRAMTAALAAWQDEEDEQRAMLSAGRI